MARGSFNVGPVAKNWWKTDGRVRPITYFGPSTAGTAAIVIWCVKLENLPIVGTGSLILAGLLFNIAAHVRDWKTEGKLEDNEAGSRYPYSGGWIRERARRRGVLADKLHTTLTWAVFVALILSVGVLVGVNVPALKDGIGAIVLTSFTTFIGLHLATLLIVALTRYHNVTKPVDVSLD